MALKVLPWSQLQKRQLLNVRPTEGYSKWSACSAEEACGHGDQGNRFFF